MQNWWTNSKDLEGDRGKKEMESSLKKWEAHLLSLSFQRGMITHFHFCFAPTVMLQGGLPQASPCVNSCPFQSVLNTAIWRYKTTIHLALQYTPFPEAHGANSARHNPRWSRQLFWPGTVIPSFWPPCNIYVRDLICKSSWWYRAGQRRWNSMLWPLSGISLHVLMSSESELQCHALHDTKAEIKASIGKCRVKDVSVHCK